MELLIKIRKFARTVDRNTKKLKIITGLAEDMQANGAGPCGGVVVSLIKTR